MRNKKIFSEGIVEELRKIPVFRYFFRRGKKNAQTLPKEHSLINLIRFFVFEGSPVTRAEVLFYPNDIIGGPSDRRRPKKNSCITDYSDVILMKSPRLFWWEAAKAGTGEFDYMRTLEANLNSLAQIYSISQYAVLENGCVGDAAGHENNVVAWLEIPKLPTVETFSGLSISKIKSALYKKKNA